MKKIIFLIICIIASVCVSAQAQNFQWAKALDGISGQVYSLSVVTDNSGNVLTTGYFMGKVDFDPGPSTFYLTSADSDNDIFITKTDASGNLVWAKRVGGISDEQGNSVSTDGSGNVYVCGIFQTLVDFDPGAGTFNLSASPSAKAFILKLDPSGNFVWAKAITGSSTTTAAYSIKSDVSGNTYTAGTFTETADFDPGSGSYPLTVAGSNDIFIVKLDAAGNFLLARSFGGSNAEYPQAIAIDGTGNILTTGYFQGTTDFDPGAGTYNLTSSGNLDIFINKIDALGNFVWAKQIGGTSSELGYSIAIDAGNNIITTGNFSGTVDFDPGAGISNLSGGGAFISKLNASGNFVWAKGFVSSWGYSVSVDGVGNILSTGHYSGTVDFDPGVNTFNLTASGGSDVYVSKLDNSGNFIWAKGIGGSSVDYGRSVAVDASNNVVLTGYFTSAVADFDPGTGTFNLMNTEGFYAQFVLKLNSSGSFVWAKSVGIGANAIINDIAVDAAGNNVSIGIFKGIIDFDAGAATSNLTSSQGSNDVFITKYDGSGNFLWVKQLGNSGADVAKSVAMDGSGNVYFIGNFSGTADFDPGAGIFNLTASGSSDIFISKLSSSGNFVWTKQLGNAILENGNSITLDPSGNILATGSFYNTMDLDPGAGIVNLVSSGGVDVFVLKLNSSGNFIWAKKLGGSSTDDALAIVSDISGNILTTGEFSGTCDFDPGSAQFNLTTVGGSDVFISKLDAGGNFVWAKSFGSIGTEEGLSIAVDASGNVFTTGYFPYTVDFDPGPNTYNLTSAGGQNDIYVSKLNASGNFLWAKQFGQTGTDEGNAIVTDATGNCYVTGSFGSNFRNVFIYKLDASGNSVWSKQLNGPDADVGNAIALDGSGNVYTAGYFDGITDFDPDAGIFNITSSGDPDAFILKMSQCTLLPGTPGSITAVNGTKACPGNVHAYSIAAVAGATSYTWTAPVGGVVTSGQGTTSITITYGAGFVAADSVRVVSNNACGSSAQRKKKISLNTPATPSAITGANFNVCNQNGVPYSVTNVTGITYIWSFSSGLALVASGQGTNSISANFSAGYISSTLSVNATNGCGTSANRNLTVYAKPPAPASITGPAAVCVNQQDVPYSIAAIPGTINYTWVGPTGSHISDGITTSAGTSLVTTSPSVTVDFSTSAGAVKVRANNACASGSYRTLSITFVCRESELMKHETEVSITPNPNNGAFSIQFNQLPLTNPRVVISDMLGRIVEEFEMELNLTEDFNFSLASGIYYITIINDEYKVVKKMVVE